MVKVTGVDIKPITKGDGYYKAVATIYLGSYAVNGILISEKEGNVKIRFPFVAQKERRDGHRTFAFAPLSKEAREVIEREISIAYHKKLQKC